MSTNKVIPFRYLTVGDLGATAFDYANPMDLTALYMRGFTDFVNYSGNIGPWPSSPTARHLHPFFHQVLANLGKIFWFWLSFSPQAETYQRTWHVMTPADYDPADTFQWLGNTYNKREVMATYEPRGVRGDTYQSAGSVLINGLVVRVHTVPFYWQAYDTVDYQKPAQDFFTMLKNEIYVSFTKIVSDVAPLSVFYHPDGLPAYTGSADALVKDDSTHSPSQERYLLYKLIGDKLNMESGGVRPFTDTDNFEMFLMYMMYVDYLTVMHWNDYGVSDNYNAQQGIESHYQGRVDVLAANGHWLINGNYYDLGFMASGEMSGLSAALTQRYYRNKADAAGTTVAIAPSAASIVYWMDESTWPLTGCHPGYELTTGPYVTPGKNRSYTIFPFALFSYISVESFQKLLDQMGYNFNINQIPGLQLNNFYGAYAHVMLMNMQAPQWSGTLEEIQNVMATAGVDYSAITTILQDIDQYAQYLNSYCDTSYRTLKVDSSFQNGYASAKKYFTLEGASYFFYYLLYTLENPSSCGTYAGNPWATVLTLLGDYLVNLNNLIPGLGTTLHAITNAGVEAIGENITQGTITEALSTAVAVDAEDILTAAATTGEIAQQSALAQIQAEETAREQAQANNTLSSGTGSVQTQVTVTVPQQNTGGKILLGAVAVVAIGMVLNKKK